MNQCTCTCHVGNGDAGGCGKCIHRHDYKKEAVKTLRDEFAMAALTGLLVAPVANHIPEVVDDYAEVAYRYADEMMKARDKKN